MLNLFLYFFALGGYLHGVEPILANRALDK